MALVSALARFVRCPSLISFSLTLSDVFSAINQEWYQGMDPRLVLGVVEDKYEWNRSTATTDFERGSKQVGVIRKESYMLRICMVESSYIILMDQSINVCNSHIGY